MFDTKLAKPRGFSGRPLIALLFAVVMEIWHIMEASGSI
jgi:hypothetical protein